ncbi:biotin/lipoyl-containing protein [Murdochiella massiliensis]|uniref:biotin/lipoyl-containing protein n=1 Tax=Murdochiella massiliensis TaxID=1673723 RepID=UPI00082F4D8D|nr:biotin/lipoyl-containing protein [Murdochiella massiliensis]
MQKTYHVTVEGKTYEVTLEEVGAAGSPVYRAPQAFAPVAPVAPVAPAAPAAPQTPKPAPAAEAKPVEEKKPHVAGDGEDQEAPLQGNIWKIVANEGDEVAAGDTVIILEAMKMENEIVAPRDGVIGTIYVTEGQTVDTGEALYSLK